MADPTPTPFDELTVVKAALRRQALEDLETVVRNNLDAMPADNDEEAEIVFAIQDALKALDRIDDIGHVVALVDLIRETDDWL